MQHTVFELRPGSTPLLISMPHVGSLIPEDQHHRYTDRALASEDTDWHLEQLYAPIAQALGAGLLIPRYSRYLIDLNRPPQDTPMYPGASNTELCPTRHFTGEPLYRDGQAPDAAEQQRRLEQYWQPYHQALQGELQRLRQQHGQALLFEAHSIRGELPWLFEGRLPDLNLGTAQGQSCRHITREALKLVLESQDRYTQVTDGRFKGGYITRAYGQPQLGWQAVQLEMAYGCYMQELPMGQAGYEVDAERAAQVRPLLQLLLQAYLLANPAKQGGAA
ncbi:N-formylglutamate deformylase [Roseateles sp. BYS180W]|uniref:N-formylglutamate deformylase n=1 Tax=Roseateles rivi TaxID=3299028 RepID=A0ABW7FVA0_9BURK